MKRVLLGAEAFDRFAEMFAADGISAIRVPPDDRLNDLVSSHADTLVFACGRAALINFELACRIGLQTEELPSKAAVSPPDADASAHRTKHPERRQTAVSPPDVDASACRAKQPERRQTAVSPPDACASEPGNQSRGLSAIDAASAATQQSTRTSAPQPNRLSVSRSEKTRIFSSRDFPFGNYPSDTRFNALSFCGRVYGRIASLSPDVLALAALMGFTPVNVKQGYAKCTVLPLEAAGRAITADKGLAATLRADGADVLLVAPSGIQLGKRADGFIGGASVVDEEARRVWLFGQAGSVPDGSLIHDFIRESGYTLTEGDGKLTDLGGGVILDA